MMSRKRQVIGEGAYGTVIRYNTDKCCKIIQSRNNYELQSAALREVMLWDATERTRAFVKIHRANTSRELGVDQREDHIGVIMKRATGGDLRSRYLSMGLVDRITELPHVALKLLANVLSMHAHWMVHGDIKPANVLIERKSDGVKSIKLCDLSTVAFQGRNYFDRRRELGTQGYAAPEQYKHIGVHTDPARDIYSVGMTLASFLTGKDWYDVHDPSDDMNACLDEALQLGCAYPAHLAANEIAQLIRTMVSHVPNERPTAAEALASLQNITGTVIAEQTCLPLELSSLMGRRARQITEPIYNQLFNMCRRFARHEHKNIPKSVTMASVFLAVHLYEQSTVDNAIEACAAASVAMLMDVDVPCDNALHTSVMRYFASVKFKPSVFSCDWVYQLQHGCTVGFDKVDRLRELLLATEPVLTYKDILVQMYRC